MVRRARLDGVLFRDWRVQANTKTDNAWVEYMYSPRESVDNQAQQPAYGRIRSMFLHTLPTGPQQSETRLFVNCKWYEIADDVEAVSGLPVIRPNDNWEACSIVLLQDCRPVNVVCWPHNPDDESCPLLQVLCICKMY